MSSLFWTTIGRLFARDRSRVRRRVGWWGWLRRALILLVVLAIAYGAYELPRARFLEVQDVIVMGNSQVPDRELIRRSDVLGRNLITLDTSEAERRLEQIPYIQSARVEKGLTTTVRIQVQERTPSLIVESGGARYLVSQTGVVLERSSDPLRMPDLELVGGGRLEPGQRFDQEQVAFVLTLFSELPPDLRPMIEKVSYRPETGYELISSAGWSAILGDPSQLEVKLDVMRQLLERKPNATLVDVSTPSTPYYRLK